jgi:hypothetical protein
VVPFALRPAGRGIAAGSTAAGMAGSSGDAVGGTVAGAGGQGGPGDGHVPVPGHDLEGGPEPGVGLLAPGASQPAQGVDTPGDADRTGAGVGLAERRRIFVHGDARTHIALHDRRPQLIAYHGPLGSPGAGVGLRVDIGLS